MDDSFQQSRGHDAQLLLEKATGNAWARLGPDAVEQLKENGFSMDEIYRFVAPAPHLGEARRKK